MIENAKASVRNFNLIVVLKLTITSKLFALILIAGLDLYFIQSGYLTPLISHCTGVNVVVAQEKVLFHPLKINDLENQLRSFHALKISINENNKKVLKKQKYIFNIS